MATPTSRKVFNDQTVNSFNFNGTIRTDAFETVYMTYQTITGDVIAYPSQNGNSKAIGTPGATWHLRGIDATGPHGRQGQEMTIVNSTGQIMEVTNDDGAAAVGNRIFVPASGGFFAVASGSTARFVYDRAAEHWYMTEATFQVNPIPSAIVPYSYFYGLTAGTGNSGATDYASTVAVKTSVGTGRIPFPRVGPTTGIMTAIDGSSWTIVNAGTYEVIFKIHTTEPGQWNIELNGADLPESVTSNFNPTSGGHEYTGNDIITVPAGAVLAVVNCVGNSTALTITPANGSQTHACAQSISIKRLG